MILHFPHRPRHKPYADILRQNYEQADEHYRVVFKMTDVLTEYGRRWREEALLRQHAATMALMFSHLSTLKEVI